MDIYNKVRQVKGLFHRNVKKLPIFLVFPLVGRRLRNESPLKRRYDAWLDSVEEEEKNCYCEIQTLPYSVHTLKSKPILLK